MRGLNACGAMDTTNIKHLRTNAAPNSRKWSHSSCRRVPPSIHPLFRFPTIYTNMENPANEQEKTVGIIGSQYGVDRLYCVG